MSGSLSDQETRVFISSHKNTYDSADAWLIELGTIKIKSWKKTKWDYKYVNCY